MMKESGIPIEALPFVLGGLVAMMVYRKQIAAWTVEAVWTWIEAGREINRLWNGGR